MQFELNKGLFDRAGLLLLTVKITQFPFLPNIFYTNFACPRFFSGGNNIIVVFLKYIVQVQEPKSFYYTLCNTPFIIEGRLLKESRSTISLAWDFFYERTRKYHLIYSQAPAFCFFIGLYYVYLIASFFIDAGVACSYCYLLLSNCTELTT